MSEILIDVTPEHVADVAIKLKEELSKGGNHITFKQFVEDFFLPLVKTFEMTKATVQNGLGDKATIKRDKHGFYQIKFTYVKEQV
jgi:hypothetical protein